MPVLPMHTASLAASAAALALLANERLQPVGAGGVLGDAVPVRLTVTPMVEDAGLGLPARTLRAAAVLMADGSAAELALAERATLRAEGSGKLWRCMGRDERPTTGQAVLTLEAAR